MFPLHCLVLSEVCVDKFCREKNTCSHCSTTVLEYLDVKLFSLLHKAHDITALSYHFTFKFIMRRFAFLARILHDGKYVDLA